MNKILLRMLLLCIAFLLGCSELVYVKDAEVWKTRDNGAGNERIAPSTPNVQFHRPDVDHEGRRIAVVSGSDPLFMVGGIQVMDIDGASPQQITPADSQDTMPTWHPTDPNLLAYWGQCKNDGYGICTIDLASALPGLGDRICNTNVFDYAGFDFLPAPSGRVQIIFSHYEWDHSFKLYTRPVETEPVCNAVASPLNPYVPAGIAPEDVDERLPVVSFGRNALVSAVEWPGGVGIRIRGIDASGDIGAPLTLRFQQLERITGVSFADRDEKVYFSANTAAGAHLLYYISFREWMQAAMNLLPLTPPQLPPLPVDVTPGVIDVGPGKNSSPSGVRKP
jgi:hypothetical protein